MSPEVPARPARPVRRRRPVVVPVLVALLLPVLGALPAAAAPVVGSPEPVVEPASAAVLQEQVDALRAEVERLEAEQEGAVEAWNEVRSELDQLMVAEIGAQAELDDAGRVLDENRGTASRRVRALYRTGGTVEIAWTAALSSGTSGFAEAASSFRTAGLVLQTDAATVDRSRGHVAEAVESSAEVQDLRRRRGVLEQEAQERHHEAEVALLAGQNLLAGTDAALVEAMARERREAEEAALQAALAAAAQRAAEARAAAEAAAQEAAREAALAALPPAVPAGPGDPGASAASGLSPEAAAQIQNLQRPGTVGPGGGVVAPGVVGSDRQAAVERAAASAPTAAAAAAIRAAGTRLGAPYVWGATGPSTFDCSGLTGWAYRQAGVSLPRTSRQQYAALPKVDVAAMLPGDLLFYANGSDPSSIHHVSMYLGDGLILTAPRTGDVVKVSALWSKPVYGAVRPTG